MSLWWLVVYTMNLNECVKVNIEFYEIFVDVAAAGALALIRTNVHIDKLLLVTISTIKANT